MSIVGGPSDDDLKAFDLFTELFAGMEGKISIILSFAQQIAEGDYAHFVDQFQHKVPELKPIYEKIGGRIFFLGAAKQSPTINFEAMRANVHRQRAVLFKHIVESKDTFDLRRLSIYKDHLSLFQRARTELSACCRRTGHCIDLPTFDTLISRWYLDGESMDNVDEQDRVPITNHSVESECDSEPQGESIKIYSNEDALLFVVALCSVNVILIALLWSFRQFNAQSASPSECGSEPNQPIDDTASMPGHDRKHSTPEDTEPVKDEIDTNQNSPLQLLQGPVHEDTAVTNITNTASDDGNAVEHESDGLEQKLSEKIEPENAEHSRNESRCDDCDAKESQMDQDDDRFTDHADTAKSLSADARLARNNGMNHLESPTASGMHSAPKALEGTELVSHDDRGVEDKSMAKGTDSGAASEQKDEDGSHGTTVPNVDRESESSDFVMVDLRRRMASASRPSTMHIGPSGDRALKQRACRSLGSSKESEDDMATSSNADDQETEDHAENVQHRVDREDDIAGSEEVDCDPRSQDQAQNETVQKKQEYVSRTQSAANNAGTDHGDDPQHENAIHFDAENVRDTETAATNIESDKTDHTHSVREPTGDIAEQSRNENQGDPRESDGDDVKYEAVDAGKSEVDNPETLPTSEMNERSEAISERGGDSGTNQRGKSKDLKNQDDDEKGDDQQESEVTQTLTEAQWRAGMQCPDVHQEGGSSCKHDSDYISR